MAAAVFLHNAIFTADPPPPASLAHRAPNRRGPHDRTLSSVSTVTLTTSTSEHSHPTEPLIHPGGSESSVYLDLLARQPTHPSSAPEPRPQGLTLQGDPVTPRERRSLWERSVRKRLQRLRWTGRVLLGVICSWAVYNTVRYYVGAMLHLYRDRQIINLVLGSCAAMSLACLLVSIIIAASAPHFGWYYRPRSTHVLLQDFLDYSSSLCLFAPAVVNFVLVFLWRDASDTVNSLRGRCHWDIDVVWSGIGGQCDPSPAWGYWLAGALIRLLVTGVILIAYHAVSYKYIVTRQPSRRRHTSIFRHSTSSFPPPSTRTGTTASSRSFHPVNTATTASSTTAPVSAEGSQSPPAMRDRAVSLTNSEPRALRSARSRIMSQDVSPAGSKVIRRAVSATALKPSGRQEPVREMSPTSSTSSDEDLSEFGVEDRFGRPLHRFPGSSYSSVPMASPSRPEGSSSGADAWDPVPDAELNTFAVQFRALVEQVTRETDEAVQYAQHDQYTSAGYYSGADRQDAAHVVVGRTIHRMPTIESLGSHEVMSLASTRGVSRPSTRSNTLTGLDVPPSRSNSRSNSLDAAVSLSLSLDVPLNGGDRGGAEMGELVPSPTTSTHGAMLLGSKSTGSYHTASSTRNEGGPEER
ncbi:uncharacterized protein TRAVEDRAFT_65689 [Trametes versicolor FP-101664 SS1]|uniref:uncharacterized protein n=1 Tax=Trametes versicolor (strain FP-101664) TaxID=717944 RepID=UPI00046223CD|nr:uncharacterized protein TRAVEDRAFT_65689 [Trametes versicolor FP-101664 SS1]EIW56467.1 hypothetical protein TRAVEDRAFT_65689 [Trametes versicolor FP-101664 SS1]